MIFILLSLKMLFSKLTEISLELPPGIGVGSISGWEVRKNGSL